MKDGKFVISEGEASVVREVYARYIVGETFQKIADSLTKRGVTYFMDGKVWNKNHIARMIGDKRKVLQKYKNTVNERESLRLVLKKALNVSHFKGWIASNADYLSTYCAGDAISLDMSKPDDKIIGKLVERIYSYRCSIAHAKGDVDEYIAIPMLLE